MVLLIADRVRTSIRRFVQMLNSIKKKDFFYSFSWTSKEFNCGNRGMKKTAREWNYMCGCCYTCGWYQLHLYGLQNNYFSFLLASLREIKKIIIIMIWRSNIYEKRYNFWYLMHFMKTKKIFYIYNCTRSTGNDNYEKFQSYF